MRQLSSILALSVFVSLSLFSGCDTPKTEETRQVSSDRKFNNIVEVSPEAVKKSGIQLTTVQNRVKTSDIKTIGEIRADENEVFHISSIVAGRVTRDNVKLGDMIRQGAPLAVIQNQDIVKVQATSIHELHTNQVAINQAKTRM